jgi:hypothetical protein
MTRPVPAETEAVNADSFLDIVASIVSIMIIMVLMTGLKIRHAPVDAAELEQAPAADEDLSRELSDEQTLRHEVLALAGEIQNVQRQTLLRQGERDVLATTVRTLEIELEGAERPAAGEGPQDAALSGKLSDVRSRLAEIEQARKVVETAPAPAVQVESYPTPLGRTVDGREVHLQLRGGRIAFIPLEELLARFKSDAERKVHKLADASAFTETIGPEGGFRLRYTLERHEVTATESNRTGRAGTYIRLKQWTLIPVEENLGETIDEALAENSQFRQAVADRRARGATITCWTYPDSFDVFRRLKKELYRMDFAVAARPLPQGTPISGSPDGSKSTSE